MQMISKYRLRCSCEQAWVWVDADSVDIQIDLVFGQRIYRAICPACGELTENIVEDKTIG